MSGSQPPPPPLPQPFPGPGLPSVAVTGADTGDRIHYHKTKANRGGGHCALSLRYAFIVPCVCPPILKLQNEFDLLKLTASQYQTHDVFTVRAGGARQGRSARFDYFLQGVGEDMASTNEKSSLGSTDQWEARRWCWRIFDYFSNPISHTRWAPPASPELNQHNLDLNCLQNFRR